MQFTLRHIFLIAGIVGIITSFLFFGRMQNTYTAILLFAIFFVGLSSVLALFKDTWKSKIAWLGILIVAFFIEQFSEKWLIAKSYQILLLQHQNLFDQANKIMQSKPNDLTFWGTDHEKRRELFSDNEIQLLQNLKERARLTYITKSSNHIFYETYGFLDSRGGLSYFYVDSADSRFTKIKGRWYF